MLLIISFVKWEISYCCEGFNFVFFVFRGSGGMSFELWDVCVVDVVSYFGVTIFVVGEGIRVVLWGLFCFLVVDFEFYYCDICFLD